MWSDEVIGLKLSFSHLARIEKDLKDISMVVSFLSELNHFSEDQYAILLLELLQKTSNAEKAKTISAKIVNSMVGKYVTEYSFKIK